MSSNTIVAVIFLVIPRTFGSDTFSDPGSCGAGGCVGENPSVELLQRDLDFKIQRHENTFCIPAGTDLYSTPNTDPECCTGSDNCVEPRPTDNKWHCSNTQPGQQCWNSRVMCRTNCNFTQCTDEGADRWGPDMGGCCKGFVECKEPRPPTDPAYSKWTTRIMCRSDRESCQALDVPMSSSDSKAASCRLQPWHTCDKTKTEPNEKIQMNNKHDCFNWCQTMTNGTCCQFNEARLDSKNCQYWSDGTIASIPINKNGVQRAQNPEKMAYTMGCTPS